LKRYKADIFISPDNFLSLSTDIPTILVVHDIAFKHFKDNDSLINRLYYQFFIPRFLKKASHILTVSAYTKVDIVEKYPIIPKDKISVCYNGCRQVFTPLSINQKNEVKMRYTEGYDYFLFVGAIHPRKNVHRLIEAFDLFKKQTKSTIKLVIVGRMAWQAGSVKNAYDKAQYQKDIIFTGFVNEMELTQITASALACTYISLFEGFGVPLLEAMCCDVPIITANISAMPEVAGEAALLVDPESTNDIAQAMQRVSTDSNLREKLIQKGRIQRQKFDWDNTAKTVYDSILKSNS
jgi:glycosyltransferase involved in cell wall biosynthesis